MTRRSTQLAKPGQHDNSNTQIGFVVRRRTQCSAGKV